MYYLRHAGAADALEEEARALEEANNQAHAARTAELDLLDAGTRAEFAKLQQQATAKKQQEAAASAPQQNPPPTPVPETPEQQLEQLQVQTKRQLEEMAKELGRGGRQRLDAVERDM